MAPRACIICGALGTARWTLTNGDTVSVADLCGTHGLPLDEIVAVAGVKPPVARDELRLAAPPPPIQRQPRRTSFEPLEWEPPPED